MTSAKTYLIEVTDNELKWIMGGLSSTCVELELGLAPYLRKRLVETGLDADSVPTIAGLLELQRKLVTTKKEV